MKENTILLLTIALLVATYWVLIWRINKLIRTIANFEGKLKNAEASLHATAKYMQGLYAHIMSFAGLGSVKDGKVHIDGKLEKLGQISVDLSLKKGGDSGDGTNTK